MRAVDHFAAAEKYLQQAKTDLGRELGEDPDLMPEDHSEIVKATLLFAQVHTQLAAVALEAEKAVSFGMKTQAANEEAWKSQLTLDSDSVGWCNDADE